MEVNDDGKCNPTYIECRTNWRGIFALLSGFEKGA
jgi:hypothetical protein